jgi:ribonuclease R
LHKAGIFVRIDAVGAEGLVPRGLLPDDFWDHDAGRHILIGRRTGLEFRLGDTLEVVLHTAEPISGGLIFSAAIAGSTGPTTPKSRGKTTRKPQRRRRIGSR